MFKALSNLLKKHWSDWEGGDKCNVKGGIYFGFCYDQNIYYYSYRNL